MFKSRKFNLILIGCISLLMGIIFLPYALLMQSRLGDISTVNHVGTVASTSAINFNANIINDAIEWIKAKDTWLVFVIIVGVSFVCVSILLFFFWSMYKLFFGKSKGESNRNAGMMYEDGMEGDEEFSPPAPVYGGAPMGGNPGDPYRGGASQEFAPQQLPPSNGPLPQLDRMPAPDMSGANQLAPPNGMASEIFAQSNRRAVSNEIQNKFGFDLNQPFSSQRVGRKGQEETEYDLINQRIEQIRAERDVIEERLLRVSEEYNLLKAQYDAGVAQAENDIVEMQTEIADLQGWLHQAPKKEKDSILDEIESREMAIGEAYAHISNLSDPNSGALADLNVLKAVQSDLYNAKIENEEELIKAKSELQLLNMREEMEAPEREKLRKEKVLRLRGIMQEANRLQAEDDAFEDALNKRNKEKELLKTENITLQHAIMSMADLEEVVSISQKIQSNNTAIMELDKKNSDELRNRTVRPASLAKLKRDADDLILELELSYADVVKEEDEVLIEETRQRLIDEINDSKRVAQDMIIRSQHKHDTLIQDYHRNLTDAAFDISNAMRDAEQEVVYKSEKLKVIVDKLVLAKGAQANLLTIDRLAAEDEVQLAKVNLERVKAQGIKDRIVAKTKLDNDIVEASKDVDRARRDYDTLISKQRNIESEAVYAVISGSGVISKLCKEYEKLKKEKEDARIKSQQEYEKRQAELLGERERLSEEQELETRLQMALQGDVIRAQKGDKEARNRLEGHLTSRMNADERELFAVMRPDEKWRYIVMEVEEIIRRAQHSSKEKLAALVAEEEAMIAKLEADERVRKAEEAAEDARRKMESQIAQSQIDADYARLQSVDTLVAAKELAEKQAEEIMRVAYEERRKASDLIDAVKQRSIEAKKQAEEIVQNIKIGNIEGLNIDVSAENVADSNKQFSSIVDQIVQGSDTQTSSAAESAFESNDLSSQILQGVNFGGNGDVSFAGGSNHVAFNENSTFEGLPIDGDESDDMLYNKPAPKYQGNVHSKSDFSGGNVGGGAFSQIDAEIDEAARELDFANKGLEFAQRAAQSVSFYENNVAPAENFVPEKPTKAEDIEQMINAKVEQRLKEENERREALDRIKQLEEEQRRKDEVRQKQLDEELEKIKLARQKIEQEQAQQKLLLEEKKTKSNADENKLDSIQQQALLFEKQTIEAQKRALEDEKKALEQERMIKEQIEETKRQLKEEQERIEAERQKQIEESNREVEKLKLELLEEKKKEELRKVEEEKEVQISFINQEIENLRQQVEKEKQNVEHIKSMHEQEMKHQQEAYAQELKEIEQQQIALAQDTEAQLLKALDLDYDEAEDEMKNAPYFAEDAVSQKNASSTHPYIKVRDNVNIVASDIRRMAKDAAAQATKQAQEAKEEAERLRLSMEQEILRVRQELENSLKQKEVDAQVAAYEFKAQEEVKAALLRAEKAEAYAKQAEQTEIITKQKVEEAIQGARKAAEDAIADAIRQSKDANEMVNKIRSQADQEVSDLKKELQKELQEMRQERDKEIGSRTLEYEKALQNAEALAAARAEKAEKAFAELELATQKAIAESERRAEQLAKDAEQRATTLAKEAEERANAIAKESEQKAREAEERARVEAKQAQDLVEKKAREAEELVRQLAREAEDRVKEAEERARQEAKLAQELADQKAREAEDKVRQLAREAEDKVKEAEEKARQIAREADDKARQLARETEEKARQEAREFEERTRQEAKLLQEQLEQRAREAQELAEQRTREAEEKALQIARDAELRAREIEERAKEQTRQAQLEAEQKAKEAEERARVAAREAEQKAREIEERAKEEARHAQLESEQRAKEADERAKLAAREAEQKAREAEERAKEEARQAQLDADQKAREAQERANIAAKEAQEKAYQATREQQEKEARIHNKVSVRKGEISLMRERIAYIKTESDLNIILEKLNNMSRFLDEDERSSSELNDLISRTISDARHASEMAILRAKLDETVANANANPTPVPTAPVAQFENLLPPPLRRPRQMMRRPVAPMSRPAPRGPRRPGGPGAPGSRPYRPSARSMRPGVRRSGPRVPRDY